jgi:hypothetical protein
MQLSKVLKFSPSGKLLMEVGRKLEPGSGKDRLCKPTQVSAAAIIRVRVLRQRSKLATPPRPNPRGLPPQSLHKHAHLH